MHTVMSLGGDSLKYKLLKIRTKIFLMLDNIVTSSCEFSWLASDQSLLE